MCPKGVSIGLLKCRPHNAGLGAAQLGTVSEQMPVIMSVCPRPFACSLCLFIVMSHKW